jgi:hypothetical protein
VIALFEIFFDTDGKQDWELPYRPIAALPLSIDAAPRIKGCGQHAKNNADSLAAFESIKDFGAARSSRMAVAVAVKSGGRGFSQGGGQSSGEGGRGGGRQQFDAAHWRPRRPMEVEVILEAEAAGGDTGGAGRVAVLDAERKCA